MLERLTDRIYYMMNDDKTDRPALGIVRGDDCCLIIDAGNSPKHAKEFKKEIEAMNFPEVKYLILTHHHWDHTFGLEEWKVSTITNRKTYEFMKTYISLNYDDASLEEAKGKKIFKDFPISCIKEEIENRESFHPMNANIILDGQMEINLGGITCIIRQITSPHTDDSTIVYIPEEKTMFLGDCLYGYTSQGYNYYNKALVFEMIDTIEKYDAEYYVCSHESVCSREEIVSFWKQLHMGVETADKSSNIEEAVKEFKGRYEKEPSDEDLFFIKSFGIGDTWGRTEPFEPEMF